MNNKVKTNVVIVGRSNVGKSTLFNRLIQKRISIVLDQENVTRDRIYQTCEWLGERFELIDTGGISKKLNLSFQEEINMQVDIAIKESDIIIFLVSGKDGVTKEDILVASKIKKIKNKKIILAVNKIDSKEQELNIYEFFKLGLGEPIAISSIHGIGTATLLEKIVKNINKEVREVDPSLRIGIIGKPNVGKSTLVNTLLNENRVIVSEISGTTRDAVDTAISFNGEDYTIVDTAGIKKNKNALSDVEWYSEIRSNLTILNSDIILLLLDYKNEISFIDEKILGILKEEYKPTIIFINKMDELTLAERKAAKEELVEKFKFAPWIQVEFISALSRKNVHKLFDKINELNERRTRSINKSLLNDFLMDIQIIKQPPRHNGILVKLSYITFSNNRYPHFIIFSNHPEMVHFSYKRFIENQLRNVFDFKGIPIKISFREKR